MSRRRSTCRGPYRPTRPRRSAGGSRRMVWYSRIVRTGSPTWRARSSIVSGPSPVSLADPPDAWPAELVARLMPDPVSARKETIVQRAVAAAGFPTPPVRVSGGADDGLGRAFMVMDRAAGSQPLAGLDAKLTPAVVL